MNPAELQAAIDRIREILRAAAAETQGSTWEFDTWPPAKQRSAPASIVEATQEFFLKLNLGNGQLLDRVQSPDPPAISPAGIFADLVRPIVDLLEAQTALIAKGVWIESEMIAFAHWQSRLAYYRAQIDKAPHGATPSPEVWANVSMPLFMGLYPQDQGFKDMGIANPKVRSPPDVVYLTTVFWMASITKQSHQQAWDQLWVDLEDRTMLVIETIASTAAEVVTKGAELAGKAIGSAAGGLIDGLSINPAVLVGVAALGGGAYYLSTRKKD